MTKPVISTNYFRNNSAVLINIACCKVLDPRRQMSQMLCNVVCLHPISRSLDTSGQVIYPHIFPSSPLLINVRSGTVRCARAIINTALSLTNPKHIFPSSVLYITGENVLFAANQRYRSENNAFAAENIIFGISDISFYSLIIILKIRIVIDLKMIEIQH